MQFDRVEETAMLKHRKGIGLSTVIIVLIASTAAAQTELPTDSAKDQADAAANRQNRFEGFRRDAQTYRMTLVSAKPIELQLLPQSVLNWDGSVFVWLRDGRPEVIGAFWTNLEPRTGRVRYPHALHSLSEYPIKAEFDAKLIWNPSTSGLKFRRVEGAPEPADKSWRRLAQMRELSREFSVKGVYPRYQEITARPLRLFTNPIYRYEPASGGVQDGAIFVYSADVVTTDPDALLVLESHLSNGKFSWQYAFARFHFNEWGGDHRDIQVWKVENDWAETKQHLFGDGPGREKVYYSVERRP
jgi:hypothetical protein